MRSIAEVAEVRQGVESLEDIAERQDGVASVAQAVGTGLTMSQIAGRRVRGRYRRCRRGVVQVAGVPPSWRQRVRIASIAAGARVVVSHASAVQLYGLERRRSVHRRWKRCDAFIEVSAPDPRQVRLAAVRGHRSGYWQDDDVGEIDGIAVTSPARTVVDMSSRLGLDGTGRLVDDMLRRDLLTIAQLRERIADLRPAPGRSMRVLRAVVAARDDEYDAGESNLESRILRIVRRAGFPAPVSQHWVRDGDLQVRLDFAYPAPKVYLEGDSFGFHRMRSDIDRDARKRNGLILRGWVGLHLTAVMTDAEIERNLATLYDRTTGQWRRPSRPGPTDTA